MGSGGISLLGQTASAFTGPGLIKQLEQLTVHPKTQKSMRTLTRKRSVKSEGLLLLLKSAPHGPRTPFFGVV
jgi:hypothetical protein